MNGQTPRHGNRFSKSPPFLLPGLVIVVVILGFNYWRTSRLNKELLMNVSVAQAKSQRLDHDLKEALQQSVDSKKSFEEQIRQLNSKMASQQTRLENEKNDLKGEVQDMEEDLDKAQGDADDFKDELARIKTEKEDLTENIRKKNQTIKTLIEEKRTLAVETEKLQRDFYVVMSYVTLELGKDGIEALLRQQVSLPANLTIPSSDQQARCAQRADDRCKEQLSKMVVHQPEKVIDSPNRRSDETNIDEVKTVSKPPPPNPAIPAETHSGEHQADQGKENSADEKSNAVINSNAGQETADKGPEIATNGVEAAGNDDQHDVANGDQTADNNGGAVATKENDQDKEKEEVKQSDTDNGEEKDGEKEENNMDINDASATTAAPALNKDDQDDAGTDDRGYNDDDDGGPNYDDDNDGDDGPINAQNRGNDVRDDDDDDVETTPVVIENQTTALAANPDTP